MPERIRNLLLTTNGGANSYKAIECRETLALAPAELYVVMAREDFPCDRFQPATEEDLAAWLVMNVCLAHEVWAQRMAKRREEYRQFLYKK